jgi:hypothetical protein
MQPPVNLPVVSAITSPSLALLSPNCRDTCGKSSNGSVHPPIREDTLAVDIPCAIGGEKDTGLTDFLEGRGALRRDGFSRKLGEVHVLAEARKKSARIRKNISVRMADSKATCDLAKFID